MKKKIAEPPVCHYGSNEPTLASQFEWSVNTFNCSSEKPVFRIRIRIGIRMFLGLPDPHPDYKYESGWGSGSGSFPFLIKVLSGLKQWLQNKFLFKNFLAQNLISIIKHIFTILKILNFIFLNIKKYEKIDVFAYRKSLKILYGSVSQRYGSEDPDPYQNVTDLEHCEMPWPMSRWKQ